MVNPAIAILTVIIVIVAIAVIAVLIAAAIADRNTDNGSTNPNSTSCGSNVNLSNLVQISTNTPVCNEQGVPTSFYYIGNISNLDFVVAPFPTQPVDVCVGYCDSYLNGVCTGASFNGKTAQENFNTCVNQLSSQTCQGPLPIAAKGPIIYYAYSPTCRICDGCVDS